jgi:hypothetical protein
MLRSIWLGAAAGTWTLSSDSLSVSGSMESVRKVVRSLCPASRQLINGDPNGEAQDENCCCTDEEGDHGKAPMLVPPLTCHHAAPQHEFGASTKHSDIPNFPAAGAGGAGVQAGVAKRLEPGAARRATVTARQFIVHDPQTGGFKPHPARIGSQQSKMLSA